MNSYDINEQIDAILQRNEDANHTPPSDDVEQAELYGVQS